MKESVQNEEEGEEQMRGPRMKERVQNEGDL